MFLSGSHVENALFNFSDFDGEAVVTSRVVKTAEAFTYGAFWF